MQFIQTRVYERKRKCKRKLARERKRARVKRKILRALGYITIGMPNYFFWSAYSH